MDRRRLLRAGAVALAGLVPGCGLGSDDTTATPDDPASSERPAATATATPTATASPTPDPTPTATATPTATPTATATPAPDEAAQVVAVGDGSAEFEPEVFEISTGETVVWVWHSSGHNVQATARPRGSTFTGTAGGDETTYEEGHTFAHTFEVAGEYEFRCYPYRDLGMTGSFTVTE
ncbi:plastocyanin/azurin family copper-binding protein [Halosimplex pelagicum]|uniref:Halocyanin n=1 Tax=Halosimplex pelagicum TaxID=869886 RepID=A0A7D5SU76_9EURY|nr:plastocyanin/azurin family copper-binding protein [Halosimplex pelagicum]QLH81067.1 halocyanin [Halosimplex pelagicum]